MSVQHKTHPVVRPRAGHDYRTLLVHVQPGLAGSHRVELAAGLARRFGARLIGVGAESCEPVATVDPFGGQVLAELYEQRSRQVEADLQNAEAAFLRDAAGGDIEWRAIRAAPGLAMVQAARAADLIVATADEARSGDLYVAADPVDLILTGGRPVLVAAGGDGHLTAERILVAWKDTREARGAVADALPFLVRADEVLVLAACEASQAESALAGAEDVAAALRRHGVAARAKVLPASADRVASTLNAEAEAIGADLIVAGAYGRSRLMEWVLGGVTRDLLRNPQRYLFFRH